MVMMMIISWSFHVGAITSIMFQDDLEPSLSVIEGNISSNNVITSALNDGRIVVPDLPRSSGSSVDLSRNIDHVIYPFATDTVGYTTHLTYNLCI